MGMLVHCEGPQWVGWPTILTTKCWCWFEWCDASSCSSSVAIIIMKGTWHTLDVEWRGSGGGINKLLLYLAHTQRRTCLLSQHTIHTHDQILGPWRPLMWVFMAEIPLGNGEPWMNEIRPIRNLSPWNSLGTESPQSTRAQIEILIYSW